VTKRGVPLAQVVPPPTPPPNLDSGHGSMAGTIQLLGDIVEPVGEKDWEVLKD
jgi:hypothetical protein